MTVKEIRQINLEYQGMTLRDRGALDNRKIVVEVVLTSDVAQRHRQIPEKISTLGDKAIRILIKESGTIEIVVGARAVINFLAVYNVLVRKQPGCSVLHTPGEAKRRIEIRFIRTIDGDARDKAVLEVATTALRRRRKAVHDDWRTALITVHSADLPTAEDFAGRSMIKVFLSGAGREFVEIADNNGVRSVLIAQGFFRLQIERILCTEIVRLKRGKEGESTVSVG